MQWRIPSTVQWRMHSTVQWRIPTRHGRAPPGGDTSDGRVSSTSTLGPSESGPKAQTDLRVEGGQESRVLQRADRGPEQRADKKVGY